MAQQFAADARDQFSREQVSLLEEASTDPETRRFTMRLEGAPLEDEAEQVETFASQYGSPKFQKENIYYWTVRSDGSTVLVSKTLAQFDQFLQRDSTDHGVKALGVHYTRVEGRDTYYGDGVCQIKHVDAFADSVVLTWGRCANPDWNSVNDYDVWLHERDYYGNRGDKYYNEFWVDVNPSGSQYPPKRANREGPKWRNPDGGGPAYWL